ncbi:insulinase family protein [Xylanibacter brevis]|uniref:insulinase family protein n=1 Tax=Xylanibacter brevis TaxID=83231 RepID=UPI000485FC68|nr:insulinase family protein [Xylanibacter brevis]
MFAHQDKIDQQMIPADSTVRKGVLANGMTYYVCRCDNPEKRVYFELLVRGGSMVEQDNELGIAHFVEHMAFKGTKHFPNNRVIDFMRHNGIVFGHHSNAFTEYNTVRYLLHYIPSDNALLVDSCLLLLRDWSSDIVMADEDAESERNVIVEEWRMRKEAPSEEQALNEMLNHSAYTKRSPIGDMDIIKNCSPQLLRDFYHRWYEPQNQTVIIVGDVNPDVMVEKLKARFGDRVRGKHVVAPAPKIPDADGLRLRCYQSKVQNAFDVTFLMKVPDQKAESRHSIGGLRTDFMRDKITKIMRSKMMDLQQELTGSPGLAFDNSLKFELVGGGEEFLSFKLSSAPDQWQSTLETLMKQVELIRRKGFTHQEWKETYTVSMPEFNADTTALILVDTTFVERTPKQRTSVDLMKACTNDFLKGKTIKQPMASEVAHSYIVSTMTQEQMHQEFLKLTDDRNLLITMMFPEKANVPTEEEALAVVKRVKQMCDDELLSVEKLMESEQDDRDIDSTDVVLVPPSLKKFKVLNDSISEAFLPNGVKVVLWKDKGSVLTKFVFYRPSGLSVLNNEEYGYRSLLDKCVVKYKNGPILSFDDYSDKIEVEIFEQSAVENSLKGFYLNLTCTDVDSVKFYKSLKQLQEKTATSDNPLITARNKIKNLPSASLDRINALTADQLSAFSLDHFCQIVKKYKSNYNGSVLLVHGNYEIDSIMPSIMKYIATLPSEKKPVKRMVWPSDHYKTSNSTLVEKVEMDKPYCETYIMYVWEKGYKYTPQTNAHNNVLQRVLGKLLFNVLRKQHSDVYSPFCSVNTIVQPIPRLYCPIIYTCDPSQRERIAQDVRDMVNDMVEGGLITQELIDSSVKEIETSNKQVMEFLKANKQDPCNTYLNREFGDELDDPFDLTCVRQVTPASLKAYLRKMLKKGSCHIGYITTE